MTGTNFIAIFFKRFELAKDITTSNKALDINDFLEQISSDCFKSTGVRIQPVLVNTNLAGQLKNRILVTYGREGRVKSQMMYANMILLIGLRIDKKMEEEMKVCDDDWVDAVK